MSCATGGLRRYSGCIGVWGVQVCVKEAERTLQEIFCFLVFILAVLFRVVLLLLFHIFLCLLVCVQMWVHVETKVRWWCLSSPTPHLP